MARTENMRKGEAKDEAAQASNIKQRKSFLEGNTSGYKEITQGPPEDPHLKHSMT